MKLSEIFRKKGIELYNDVGELRNPIDIIEDMYLKLNGYELIMIMKDIEYEEGYANIFDNERGGEYNGN